MSRRDYLKHLGFATAQAMANASKTQTMALSRKLFDRIEKASVNFGIENQTISPYIAYRRGATEWTEKAQGLLDALKLISETKSFTDKEGFVKQIADNAIAKYEGKEVNNE